MNIDKNMLNTLASLDDKSLSATIRMIAATTGLDLGNMQFSPKTLNALRAAMREANDADVTNAKRIFEEFTDGRKQS